MFRRKQKEKIETYKVRVKFEIELINNYESIDSETIKLTCDENVLIKDEYYVFRRGFSKISNVFGKPIDERELRHYLFYLISKDVVLHDTEGKTIHIKKPYIVDIKILHLEDIEYSI